MNLKRKKLVLIFAAMAMQACATYSPIADNGQIFTRKQIEDDFDSFMTFVSETHPNIEYSADIDELAEIRKSIRNSFTDGMSLHEAWMAMAQINPVFKDAHIGVRRPVKALEAYEAKGGKLFPGSVLIDETGVMRFGPSTSLEGINAGDRILSINGVKAEAILELLQPRMRGESKKLGRLLLERYFPEYFWVSFGGYDSYVVRVNSDGRSKTLTLTAQHTEGDDASADRFTYEKLNDEVAYLNVTTFSIDHSDEFEQFLLTSFDIIKRAGLRKLIIDLRGNGGGARDLSDMLMAYLTAEPYSAISRVTARVTEENLSQIPGATLGSVITIPFQQVVRPAADNPLRFEGEIYALTGGLTYSQAIIFAATLQDHKIALIAGEETEGPANQTGQVQFFTMPNTGVEGLSPIYIFTRASGDATRAGVTPDIKISDDPAYPMRSVEALIDVIRY